MSTVFVRRLALVGALALLLANCGNPKPPNAGQPTIQGQSMARMLATVDLIRAYTRGDAAQADANKAAMELLSWSDRIGELFPPEVASEYVDLTPETARAAPAVMHATAESLLVAVQSGSRPATADALDHTEHDGCGLCHRTPYR